MKIRLLTEVRAYGFGVTVLPAGSLVTLAEFYWHPDCRGDAKLASHTTCELPRGSYRLTPAQRSRMLAVHRAKCPKCICEGCRP